MSSQQGREPPEKGICSSPSSGSLLDKVHPVARAINTISYGTVVYFATLCFIDLDAKDAPLTVSSPPPLLQVLFLHEFWVYLQHWNVFGNPLLQHLDRQYGIALLKSNKHWSIAGTLAAYWCRESICMFLCLPFLSLPITRYLVLYSLIYHNVKSRGVRDDALRRHSSKFGIMRLVIDKFYTHTWTEVQVSLVRLFLQGSDTFIHFAILRDLILGHSHLFSQWFREKMNVWFVVWVAHAALNQLFRCSTATLIVQAWNAMARKNITTTISREEVDDVMAENRTEILARSMGESGFQMSLDDEFVVRKLLHPKRVPDKLKGRYGSASNVVDKAVRLETIMTILVSFFMIGLGQIPMEILKSMDMDWAEMNTKIQDAMELVKSMDTFPYSMDLNWTEMSIKIQDSVLSCDSQVVIATSTYAWLLWGMLYGIWSVFLKSRGNKETHDKRRSISLKRFLLYTLDLAVMLGIASKLIPVEQKWRMLPICLLLTGKSFLSTVNLNVPKIAWKFLLILEFIFKLEILRQIAALSENKNVHVTSSILTFIWSIWVLTNPTPTPCEAKQINGGSRSKQENAADAVFLGHPAYLQDIWGLWMMPYSRKERFEPPFFAPILWPLYYVIGWFICNYNLKLFGDEATFVCADNSSYDGKIRMQTWISVHFGRHFFTHPRLVKDNIEATARHAEKIGVKVLCLGALNKAESINGGGVTVAQALGPERKISIIHGNHLTAAAVVETIFQCFGERKVKLFLTGASSKVGWAVAQALRDRFGYEVLCHSSDPGRRRFFEQNGFASASTLSAGASFTKYWIVGKNDMEVPRIIPQNATAIIFSVPHSLECRRDVRIVEAGTLHLDLTRLNQPRLFTNNLKEHEIFACHAASLVASYRLQKGSKRIDEVGPVDPHKMDSWLEDARKLGLTIPSVDPVIDGQVSCGRPPVVIVGCGPAGLSAAATLSQRQIPCIVLEAQKDRASFGSWSQHFTGLEVTSQKRWSNLPGFPMNPRDFPNENVTAHEYQAYLQQYVQRFDIKIQRGIRVKSIQKGGLNQKPWLVKYLEDSTEKEMPASAVIVATGKHYNKNVPDDLVQQLTSCNMKNVVHSTELRDEATWTRAIEAARKGKLCMVGLGNSTADITAMILHQCQDIATAKIHIAARTVPHVFPRKRGPLRIDTIGYLISWMPDMIQDSLLKLIKYTMKSSRLVDASFPAHLKRWSKINGRVPVVDKFGMLAHGFKSGQLVGHGPILDCNKNHEVTFCDRPLNVGDRRSVSPQQVTKIDMVILGTGYRDDCVVGREDRLHGLYKIGFGRDNFLPLKTISDDAKAIAKDIASNFVTTRAH